MVKVTEVSINIKLGKLIWFYCIEPHMIGLRWYTPEKPKDKEWVKFLW